MLILKVYYKFLVFLSVSLIFTPSVFSQILDDSTRLVYGPTTTKYVTEEDVLNNLGDHVIDTALSDIHNYDFYYKGKEVYQNLGILGTPITSIYYAPPQTIGRNFGFTSFDRYATDPTKVHYYDTRSPFTSLYYVQGASGQQIGEAEFARNIKPNWNFGFAARRMTSNRIIGARSERDRLADHTSFLFFTRFFTKDSAYQVLANYTWMDHKYFETGGVKRDSAAETNDTFFDDREENVNLSTARSTEKRIAFHVYQQLSLPRKESIQLYHIFDYYSQVNAFRANLLQDTIFYAGENIKLPNNFIETATLDRTDFRLLENKAGIKGVINNFYYRGYYRRKDFYYKQYYYIDSIRRFNENFLGGNLSYRFTDKISLNVSAENLFAGNKLHTGIKDYLFRGEFVSPYFTGGVYRINHSPTMLQLKYYGNNLFWNNLDALRFNNTTSDNIYANGNVKWKFFTVNPGVNFSTLKNYIYFDTLAIPAQDSSSIQVLSLDLMLKFQWRWFNIENFIKYTTVSKPEIIRVPEIYNHCRVYFQSHLFKKALTAQLGVDLFWKSDYYANKYMSITQQFYLNNDFLVNSYLVADVFLDVRVKRVNGFLKFSHFNKGFVKDGYFTTPYYTGLPRNFEFGIQWLFFD